MDTRWRFWYATAARSVAPDPLIRHARAADRVDIARLLGQLGYPASPDEAAERLSSLAHGTDAASWVASRDDHVVGLATGHVFRSIHASEPVAWVTTLVVDAAYHRQGIAQELLRAVEHWARFRGAIRISVSSGRHRAEAHAFYAHVGYEETGVRLTKSLATLDPHAS